MCDMDGNLARLRTVLAATTPAGVGPLLGGVAKVCRHLFLLAWVSVSGRKPSSFSDWRWRRLSVVPLKGALGMETWPRGSVLWFFCAYRLSE